MDTNSLPNWTYPCSIILLNLMKSRKIFELMGLKCSPDFAQEVMENILGDISKAEVYIDDIGVITNTWEEHMKGLHIVQ